MKIYTQFFNELCANTLINQFYNKESNTERLYLGFPGGIPNKQRIHLLSKVKES